MAVIDAAKAPHRRVDPELGDRWSTASRCGAYQPLGDLGQPGSALARLCRPKIGPTNIETAASMIRWLAICHCGRKIHVVAPPCDHRRPIFTHRQVAPTDAEIRTVQQAWAQAGLDAAG